VELSWPLKRRFYPPLLLLDYLRNTTRFDPKKFSDPPTNSTSTPEETFHCFVSKVASLCDTDRRGSTVSACTVLQLPDRIQYVFASNNRNANQLGAVERGVESVLRMVHTLTFPQTDEGSLRGQILRAALTLGSDRVTGYLNSLFDRLEDCEAECARDSTNDGK